MGELRECPFCGENELIEIPTNEVGYDPKGDVSCFGCGATGPIRDAAGARADAKERWNTRYPTGDSAARDEALEECEKLAKHEYENCTRRLVLADEIGDTAARQKHACAAASVVIVLHEIRALKSINPPDYCGIVQPVHSDQAQGEKE